jgi:hypothetical protein
MINRPLISKTPRTSGTKLTFAHYPETKLQKPEINPPVLLLLHLVLEGATILPLPD